MPTSTKGGVDIPQRGQEKSTKRVVSG